MKDEIPQPKGDELPPRSDLQVFAMYIAMVVRNAMEGFHHKYLSDDQMKELNPTIRNAIYTALYAASTAERYEASKEFHSRSQRMIPRYWELPKLLDDLLRVKLFLDQEARRGRGER